MLNKTNVTNGGARGKSVRPQQDAFEKKPLLFRQQNLFTNTRAPAHSKGVYLKISLHNTNVTFFHFSRHLILFRAIRTHLYIFPIKDNLQTIFERIPFGIEKIELLNFEFRTVSWFVDNTGRFFFYSEFWTRVYGRSICVY